MSWVGGSVRLVSGRYAAWWESDEAAGEKPQIVCKSDTLDGALIGAAAEKRLFESRARGQSR